MMYVLSAPLCFANRLGCCYSEREFAQTIALITERSEDHNSYINKNLCMYIRTYLIALTY